MKTLHFLWVCASLTLATSAAGCTNASTTLYAPRDRHAVNCQAVGWGLIGASLALASYNNCVNFYEGQGYTQ